MAPKLPPDSKILLFVSEFIRSRMLRQAKRGIGLDVPLGNYSKGWKQKREDMGRDTSLKTLSFTGQMLTQMLTNPGNKESNIVFPGSTPSARYETKDEKGRKVERRAVEIINYSGKTATKKHFKAATKQAKKENESAFRDVPNSRKAAGTNAQTPWLGLGPEGARACAQALADYLIREFKKTIK